VCRGVSDPVSGERRGRDRVSALAAQTARRSETVRSLASSLSPPQPPEKKAGATAAAEPSTLPSDPHGPPPDAPALVKSVSSSGSGGDGKGWAEVASGGTGELPSLLAPVELHGRDGEGATHHVSARGRGEFGRVDIFLGKPVGADVLCRVLLLASS